MDKLKELASKVRAAWYHYTHEQKACGIDSIEERYAFEDFEDKEHELLDYILSEEFLEEDQ